jgi:hypothetical protein
MLAVRALISAHFNFPPKMPYSMNFCAYQNRLLVFGTTLFFPEAVDDVILNRGFSSKLKLVTIIREREVQGSRSIWESQGIFLSKYEIWDSQGIFSIFLNKSEKLALSRQQGFNFFCCSAANE